MSRSKTRRNVIRRPRNDSPDLSGIDMSSLVERYMLVTMTIPDGLGPDKMADGVITTFNKETRTGAPWLKMHAEQIYPGDIVAEEAVLGEVIDQRHVDYFLANVDREHARQVCQRLLVRIELEDEREEREAAEEAYENAHEEALAEAAAIIAAKATVARLDAAEGRVSK